MTDQQQERLSPRYVEAPEPAEVFADSVRSMLWDGHTVRVEFCVTRYRGAGASDGIDATQHPACRLVLTAPAAAALFNRLQQTMEALVKAGAAVPRNPGVPQDG